MLVIPRVAAAMLSLLAVACSDTPGGAADRAGPPPAAGSPSASLPADVVVTHGATGHVIFKPPKQGHLWVAVETARRASGATTTTVHYERNVDCGLDPVSKTVSLHKCTVAWEIRRAVKEGAFTFDAALDTGTLEDTVRGQPLTITWHGYGDTRRNPASNGNLLVEARDARADAKFGRHRYVEPERAATRSSLYRRVSPATPAP